MIDDDFDAISSPRLHALRAEEALVGSLLIDAEAIRRVAGEVRPEDFDRQAVGRVYRAMVDLDARGSHIDYVTVVGELERAGVLEAVGGVAAVTRLVNQAPTSFGAPEYARQVAEAAQMRRLLGAADAIRSTVEHANGDATEAIAAAESILREVNAGRAVSRLVPLRAALNAFFDTLDKRQQRDATVTPGVSIGTGFADLDKVLSGGLGPGDLAILAARPSTGKSAMALNIARNVAVRQQVGVLVCSLEMSVPSCVERLLVAESSVDAQRLRQGYIDEFEWRRISEAFGVLSEAPVWFDDTSALSLSDLRARARRLHADQRIGLVVVDYLQLVRVDGARNRVDAVGEVSRGLKALARDLAVPVLALSQLSRAIEMRPDHRPQLSDLRESGSIEQDADLVLFIHREELFNPKTDRRNIADLIVAKNRNGPTASIPLRWHPEHVRFTDLDLYRQEGLPNA